MMDRAARWRWWNCRFSSKPARPSYPARSSSLILLPIFLHLLGLFYGATAAPKQFGAVEAALRQREDGPPIEAGTVFVPGEVIFFSCRLDGYKVSKEKKIAITYEFSAIDPGGVPVMETVTGKVEAELALEDKEWKPKVRQTVLVPPLAESGIYKVHFSARDELSGSVTSAEAPFEVHGHAV